MDSWIEGRKEGKRHSKRRREGRKRKEREKARKQEREREGGKEGKFSSLVTRVLLLALTDSILFINSSLEKQSTGKEPVKHAVLNNIQKIKASHML